MTRLKSKLLSFNSQKSVPTKIYSPANCEELRIPFKTDKVAKVVGKLAAIAPPVSRSRITAEGEVDGADEDKVEMISGVLVQNDFKISLMAPEDLKEYAGLTTTTILCRQHITLSAAGVDLIRWALEGTFGAVTQTSTKDAEIDGKESKMNGHDMDGDPADEEISRSQTTFTVMDCVNVLVKPGGRVEVEWEGNVLNDGIADAVLAVLFTVESSPAAVKRTSSHYPTLSASSLTHITESSKQHSHSHTTDTPKPHANLTHNFKSPHPPRPPHPTTRLARLCLFLEAQFGADSVSPIALPRYSTTPPFNPDTPPACSVAAADAVEASQEFSPEDKAELKRLHNLGIPVPGIEVKFDRFVARVWLEDLEVECGSNALRARVRAVVERGVETVSGLWS